MYAMSYYELPADVLENRPVLCQWAEKAVAVARRSATAKGR
jgi:TfoX/Sxy family transcriptional regulator of competence genes